MKRQPKEFPIMTSLTLSVIPGFKDNYFYVLDNHKTAEAVVIDPGDATPIIKALIAKNLQLSSILLTHHHRDHVEGVDELIQKWPHCKVICSPWLKVKNTWTHENIVVLSPENKLALWDFEIGILDVRGHTLDHIAFTLKENLSDSIIDVFVGDALFGAGCGGLFEGTYSQMLSALKTLRSLPNHTRVWCAHEYTLKNLRVAVQLQEENPAQLKKLNTLETMCIEKNLEPHELVTIPLILEEELQINPFLRWDAPTLKKAIDTDDELATFTFIRTFRDKF